MIANDLFGQEFDLFGQEVKKRKEKTNKDNKREMQKTKTNKQMQQKINKTYIDHHYNLPYCTQHSILSNQIT